MSEYTIGVTHNELTPFPVSTKEGQGATQILYNEYGLYTPELRIVVAVMAYYRLFGIGAHTRDLHGLRVRTESVAICIRKRFLEKTKLGALRPTEKAWRELKFERQPAAPVAA